MIDPGALARPVVSICRLLARDCPTMDEMTPFPINDRARMSSVPRSSKPLIARIVFLLAIGSISERTWKFAPPSAKYPAKSDPFFHQISYGLSYDNYSKLVGVVNPRVRRYGTVRIANALEIECLGALWQAQLQGLVALKPSEIREIVNRRRQREKRKALAVSTVSTAIRIALKKGLVKEVRVDGRGRIVRTSRRGRRLQLAIRSPNTAYRATYSPSQLLRQACRPILKACPSTVRSSLLSEFAADFNT
jgi:hypothetical protein